MTESLRLALRNVARRKKRAALTMLGVFIGIAAVVALASLGQGLQQTINDQFEKVGADKVMVQAKEMGGLTGENAPGRLTEHDLNLIKKAHGVKVATGQLFKGAKIQFNNVQRTTYLLSLPDKKKEAELMIAFSTVEIEEGRMLTHNDKGKVNLGYNVANKKMFKKNPVIGSKLDIEGEKYEVIGIFKRTGDPGMDGGAYLPEEDVRKILNESDAYSYLVAQTAMGENPDAVAERIEKVIRRDRHQKEDKEDFNVQSSTELIESFNQVLNIIQVVFIGIAAISLLVGGIGIMNTMYTAVLERTREIGVMKAIGAKNWSIMSIFLLESGLLGLAGGVVGVIIGVGISKAVEFGANASFGAGTLVAAFPWYLFVGALAFSFLVGTISGALPARRASKLKPVEALRYE